MRHVLCLLAALAASTWLVGTATAQFPAKPGPEHDMLKDLVGTWKAEIKAGDMTSEGTMTYKMELGGLWLVSKFEGDLGGMKFEGRGLDTYNPMKKKYVSVWADSMSPMPLVSEGTYDKEKKELVLYGEMPGDDGKPVKAKMVSTYKDKDTIDFTLASVKDGKENVMLSIHYTRKK